jgi:hypothetical protein
MAFRAALVVVLTLLATACGGGPGSYSADEVREAFSTEGYELVEPPPDPSGFALNPWESSGHVLLAPRDGSGFKVYVGDASADEASTEASFEAWRANVLVLSDGELAAQDRSRIRVALEGLPDRGSPVVLGESG